MLPKTTSLQSGFWALASVILSTACAAVGPPAPPTPSREFRGAWVASVSNIDWPSRPGLTSAQQQAELVAILDTAVHLKLNALFLQVRPACDALYPSKIEPWSEYLTGEQNLPPNPLYDPLEFAVTQAHLRGLELHAWFNPFRARHPSAKGTLAPNHISRRYPKLVKRYGPYLWLDPGEPVAQDYSTAVILDVVKRYDIDGVHLDDYFYPYPEKTKSGQAMEFPDEVSWARYKAAKGGLSRDDWRRMNVDGFIRKLYLRIKQEKRWVKLGISPFGIWRPGYPPQITGLDAYDQIFADSRKWILNGWADYFSPQLYWAVAQSKQSYPVLLDWWADQNKKHRHLWPGMNSDKVGKSWDTSEITNQIQTTRNQAGASGHVHWNMSALRSRSTGLPQTLIQAAYREPALVPASPWLDSKPPSKPKLEIKNDPAPGARSLLWKNSGKESVSLWIVQSMIRDVWLTEILPGTTNTRTLGENKEQPYPDAVAVSAVDRCGNIGPTTILAIPSPDVSKR